MSSLLTLRQAISEARSLGADVSTRRRTGEITFQHPLVGLVHTSATNRDATRAVSRFIRRLEQELFLDSLRSAVVEIITETEGENA